MRLSSTRLFPLALMLALALLSFWLERTARELPTQSAPRQHDPDYSVERFTIIDFSRAGTPASTLSAAKMVHYPDDDTTVLVAPHLVQEKPEQSRLTMRAERGMLSKDSAELFLYDNVLLVRAPGPETPEARMRTSFQHVVRERSLVRSDREVQFTERGRTLVGLGMEYDNESRQLALHAQVRGSFEAEPQ